MSEPAKYRKKPVVIEAVRWDGGNANDVKRLTKIQADIDWAANKGARTLTIHTLEGDMTAQVGDWIIRGVQGELYPCKPDIFEATYEPAAPVGESQQ